MGSFHITLSGKDFLQEFHNDWDACERKKILHIESFDGWYGGVSASVTPDLKRFRRHGQFPAPTIRGARKMDLVLTWHESVGGTEAYTAFSRLASAVAWDTGPYLMRVDDAGFVLETYVQLDGELSHQPVGDPSSESAFRVKVPLTAVDPFLYAPTRVFTTAPIGSGIGLEYPIAATGVVMFGSGAAASDTASNRGTATAWPKYVINGNFPGGVRITTGRDVVEYPWPIVRGTPLTVDMAGSITLRGGDVTHRATRRDWTPIPPGGRITPSLAPLQGGDGWLEVHVRDTYI